MGVRCGRIRLGVWRVWEGSVWMRYAVVMWCGKDADEPGGTERRGGDARNSGGLSSWVFRDYCLMPFAGVYVGVDFCGKDAFVSEHFLYCTQVCSVFYQMCGK